MLAVYLIPSFVRHLRKSSYKIVGYFLTVLLRTNVHSTLIGGILRKQYPPNVLFSYCPLLSLQPSFLRRFLCSLDRARNLYATWVA